MIQLDNLDENMIMRNLRLRYENDNIYVRARVTRAAGRVES